MNAQRLLTRFFNILGKRELPTVCSNMTNFTKSGCESQGIGDWYYPTIFCFGMFLIGIAGAPLYVLGVAFLDESVKRKVAPIYIGIFGASGTVGELGNTAVKRTLNVTKFSKNFPSVGSMLNLIYRQGPGKLGHRAPKKLRGPTCKSDNTILGGLHPRKGLSKIHPFEQNRTVLNHICSQCTIIIMKYYGPNEIRLSNCISF